MVDTWHNMVVSPLGGIKVRGGAGLFVVIYNAEVEYGRAVYFDAANSGPMLVVGASSGDAGL